MMETSFSPVKVSSRSLADNAAEAIRERIQQGRLKPGDQLPSERELTEQLQVSRPALREALKTLESVGLLEAHVGRGRFVAGESDPDRSRSSVGDWLLTHREEAEHLNELRTVLERRAVNGLRTPDAEALAGELRAIALEARDAVARGDAARATACDREFHLALTSRTPNRPLRALVVGLIDSAHPTATAVYAVPEAAENSLRQHEAILDALAGGDIARVEGLLEEHFQSSIAVAATQRQQQEQGTERGHHDERG